MLNSVASLGRQLSSDDLTRHGSLMVASGLIAAFLNYLYQLFMGIFLSPTEYGVLFSLTSLFAIVMTFSQTFQMSVANFASKFKTEQRWGKINYLWKSSLKRTLLLGTAMFLLSASLIPFISVFFNINKSWQLLVLFSSFILTLALPINWGMLQGLQRFVHLGFSNVLWSFLRLVAGILLVWLGFGLYGGLASHTIAYVIVFAVTLYFLRDLTGIDNEKVQLSTFNSYTALVLLGIFSFAVLTNVDIILVKHYLRSEAAGNYSAISVLGKVALYAPAGIAVAMFPKTSGLFITRQETRTIFLKALLIVLITVSAVIIIYWLFPEAIVSLLFGTKYPFVVPHLLKYAGSMALFAISFLLMNYFLSLNQTRISYFLLVAMLVELGLIAFFHTDIAQIVNVMLISGTICLMLSLFPFTKRSIEESIPDVISDR